MTRRTQRSNPQRFNTQRANAPTAADRHRDWLELVDAEGPFLAVPVLKRVWPQGIPALERRRLDHLRDAKPAFEKAWELWDQERRLAGGGAAEIDLAHYRAARDAWVEVVCRDLLGWAESHATDLSAPSLASVAAGVRSPDHRVQVTPDAAMVHDQTVGALVLVVDPVESLRDVLDDAWANSPIDRMEELLRTVDVPVGVVTDGRWWALVSARPGAIAASGVVDALTWVEEPQTRDAFVELLSRPRLVGGWAEDRLSALFQQSIAAAEEITEALGVQVRRAVELLVQAISDAGAEARARGEPDPLPADRNQVYEAAVTVMMRVVFLLFAEERDLLPQGSLFSRGYTMGGQLDELDRRARHDGAEILDGSSEAWHRLLAISQALYAGASFEDLRLPSYGGSLFDPDRFPFLTARTDRATLAVTVSDRVLRQVLRSLQMAELPGEPARRISFRDIDVEQIGYIYEGLLGYSCVDVDEVTVGLIGRKGSEPKVPLAELERIATLHPESAAAADALTAYVAQTQPAAALPTTNALAKAWAAADFAEDAERALRAVTGDEVLQERLRPFLGAIRRDLRGRPLVVPVGGQVLVETPSRASAGAHYTPEWLADEVVRYALEPLVFSPGPRETADRDKWQPISAERLLDLKVADIACGSGAFLVAAVRYLAGRLIVAWHRDGVVTGSAHDVELKAKRQVVARCLYGVDISPMAVEMCKLALWLVSLDPKLPFSFVDDKVIAGDSLLGVTEQRQLTHLHIDPPAKSGADPLLFDLGANDQMLLPLDIQQILDDAARLRRALASEVAEGDPQRSLVAKRLQWRRHGKLTSRPSEIADAVVAAGLHLGGKPGRRLDEAYDHLRRAIWSAYPDASSAGQPVANRASLDSILRDGLTPTVPTDSPRWRPVHWPALLADVMAQGGFDAVIGNPPFLGGQKLTGALGANVRDWLVHVLAGGRRGSADLVAYFLLRAMSLLQSKGTLGLIATNTVAQGDTREVGLVKMVETGFTITRAIRSRPWPASSANLEYAVVWGSLAPIAADAEFVLDDVVVPKISTLLEPTGRVDGSSQALRENEGIAFQGCIVLGMGFVSERDEAAAWIEEDPSNADVLFPYIDGKDLNSRPDASASRWVIDFTGWCEKCAARRRLPFERIEATAKPERMSNKRKVYRDYWWQFAEKRPRLRKVIAGLDEVLVIALVSKTVMPMRVPTGQVFSHKLGVFATNSFADQATLSSSLHGAWAIKYGSTMRADVNYSPSDVFLTFPRPNETESLAMIGRTLDTQRREMMLRRDLGLTKLYNLVNDPDLPDAADADVARLREIHVELDKTVCAAYGWDDVELDHGFHTYRQMTRWTVSPAARVELLDRLLEENHRRAAAQPPKRKRTGTDRPPWLADDDG